MPCYALLPVLFLPSPFLGSPCLHLVGVQLWCFHFGLGSSYILERSGKHPTCRILFPAHCSYELAYTGRARLEDLASCAALGGPKTWSCGGGHIYTRLCLIMGVALIDMFVSAPISLRRGCASRNIHLGPFIWFLLIWLRYKLTIFNSIAVLRQVDAAAFNQSWDGT